MKREAIRVALLYRGPQHEGKDEFSSFVPVGLFHLLKSLRDAGYDATIHNLSETPTAALTETIRKTAADACLISAFYGSHHQAFLLAQSAKKLFPKAPVVLGGPFSVLGGEILKRQAAIDFVIRGEGEEAAVALLDALFFDLAALTTIPGLVYRSATGCTEVPAKLLADIDHYFFLPSQVLPHCHGVRPENLAVLISSRGCPFHCAFCSSSVLWQNRVRHHSVELLLNYLVDLRATTGASYFSLRDENFLVNREHLKRFTTALADSGLFYLWNAQGSPHLLDQEIADRLAAAGCDQIQLGIETVSPRLLKLLSKSGEPSKVREAINILRSRLIRPFGYFIYGMGESEEEGRQAIDFIKKSGLIDAVASPLVVYPGTGLADGMAIDRFFKQGELSLYAPDSAKKWRKPYQQALAQLYEKGEFSREELAAAVHNPAATIARHFDLLERGEAARAAKILRDLAQKEPQNPWWPQLLAQMEEIE